MSDNFQRPLRPRPFNPNIVNSPPNRVQIVNSPAYSYQYRPQLPPQLYHIPIARQPRTPLPQHFHYQLRPVSPSPARFSRPAPPLTNPTTLDHSPSRESKAVQTLRSRRLERPMKNYLQTINPVAASKINKTGFRENKTARRAALVVISRANRRIRQIESARMSKARWYQIENSA